MADDKVIGYLGGTKTGRPDCLLELHFRPAGAVSREDAQAELERLYAAAHFGDHACAVTHDGDLVMLDFIYGDEAYVTGRAIVDLADRPRPRRAGRKRS